jgi:hypothetical protein
LVVWEYNGCGLTVNRDQLPFGAYPVSETNSEVELGAYALITRDFMRELIGVLRVETNRSVLTRLGAEHYQQLCFAANTLEALLETLGRPFDQFEETQDGS